MANPAEKFKLAPPEDPLSKFRDEFVLPTFRTMKATRVSAEIGASGVVAPTHLNLHSFCASLRALRRFLPTRLRQPRPRLLYVLIHADHAIRPLCRRTADKPCTYLCGNSLGLLPKRAKKLIEEELEVWSTRCASP